MFLQQPGDTGATITELPADNLGSSLGKDTEDKEPERDSEKMDSASSN